MDRKEVECVMEGNTLIICNIERNATIQVFDAHGKLYRQKLSGGDSIRIELEDPGVYVAVVQFHDRAVTRKIVWQP